MASHGFKSFQANIVLVGESVKQSMEFQGQRCDQFDDLTAYIADTIRPKLNNMTPNELVTLREVTQQQAKQIKDLEAKLHQAEAKASAAEKAVAKVEKVARKNEV